MRVLYICYDGIMDNLGQTQVLPYIFGLNNKGYKFIIFSFERSDRTKEEFIKQNNILKNKDIIWYHLPFYPAKFNRLLRFIFGSIKLNIIFKKHNINFVHLRSINAGSLLLFSRIKCKYLFDIRGFAGQFEDYGLLKKSWFSRLFKYMEKILVNNSKGIVVLDKSGLNYLQDNYELKVPIKVIPTSTDLKKFKFSFQDSTFANKPIRFVLLGGGQFPYLPQKALEFLQYLIKNNVNCNIDIINERHHSFINKIIRDMQFPSDKINVFPLKPNEVFDILPKYDCGLVFIKTGYWIRMSSPTKIGEYLAAGLHIVSLEGIEVLDRLAKETKCVDIIPEDFFQSNFSTIKINQILKNIQDKNRRENSIKIASKIYDINLALSNYLSLYKSISEQKKAIR